MKFKTLIVEDEHHALARMKKLLGQFDNLEIIGEATDGQTAIELIDRLKPDLIFLDIQLPKFTGFEVLEKTNHKTGTIFVTAFDQYAVRAFEENAIDYVLKPTSEERLRKAIDKVAPSGPNIDVEVLELLRNAIEKKKYLERFTVKSGLEIFIIPVSKVYRIKAEDKYLFIQTYDQEYLYDSTLKKLEEELNPDNFYRIHKSVIVARDKIMKITKSITGKYSVKLEDKNQSVHEIGRTYLPDLRKKLDF